MMSVIQDGPLSETLFTRILFTKNSWESLVGSTQNLHDVTLIINNLRRPCHKSVLTAESPYFKAMFSSNLKESYQDEIIISDDCGAMKTVIDYMYSREIKLSEENIFDVIGAADFLQVDSIRPFCDKFLSSIIKPCNCITIHIFAVQYSYIDLSIQAFHYALENFSNVFKEEDFLTAPFDVICEIFNSRVLQVESEDHLCYIIRFWINYDIEARHTYLPHLFKMLDVNKILTWVPLDVDSYLISYGIINTSVSEWLSLKYKSDSGKTSRRASPLEVVFAIGGYTVGSKGDNTALQSIEILYECEKWQFSRPNYLENNCSSHKYEEETIASMTYCRSYPSVACSDKLIYVMGGNDGSSPLQHVECYDPFTNKWETLPSLPYSLDGAAAACTNGKVYVSGGYNQNIGINNKVWVLHEGSLSWHESVPMLVKRSHHCLVTVHGVLYAIGGSDEYGNALSSMECYFIGSDSWITGESLTFPRSHFACVAHNDQIYAVCGKNNDSIERYDISLNKWLYFNKFLNNNHGHGVTIFQNRLLVIGGRDSVRLVSDAVLKLNINASELMWHHSKYLIRPRVGLSTVTLKLY